MHLHGSLGVSTEMPFLDMEVHSYHLRLADGTTEVHKVTVARQVLSDVSATDALFPAYHVPACAAAARAKYAAEVAEMQLSE